MIITSENGDEKTYTLSITRVNNNTGIEKIQIQDYDDSNNLVYKTVTEYDENTNTYTAYVSNKLLNTEIIITAVSNEATITIRGISGKGVVSYNTSLPGLGVTNYTISLIAADGTSDTKYLNIVQVPSETGIEYLKLDDKVLNRQEDEPNYFDTVHGKDRYPIEVKVVDEKAKVRIEDQYGNVAIGESTGQISGELYVADGGVAKYVVVVIAQDGTVKRNTLEITRISSNTNINTIDVTDMQDNGTEIIRLVEDYDEDTKTYKVIINRDLDKTLIKVKTEEEGANILLDGKKTGTGTVTMEKILDGIPGTTRTTVVPIEVTAVDGITKDTKYLEIIQLTNNIGLKEVRVDDALVLANSAGDYECTVTDEIDLANIKAELLDQSSKVSINDQNEAFVKTEVDVSKGNERQIVIPIKVTAADNTVYTYKLTLNILSTDTNVGEVRVNGNLCEYIDGKYVAYIDRYENLANIEIIANVKYSTVSYEKEDGDILFDKEKLAFEFDTSDMTLEEFVIPFKISAEDKVSESEYNIKLIRKSDDTSIKEVFVDNNLIIANISDPEFPDGTYTATTTDKVAKIKVTTNSELAKVEFAGDSGINSLEKTITLETDKKVTEIPVKITSQQGNTYNTTIYIRKISNDFELKYVKVDTKDAKETELENTYSAYVYDAAKNARIQIEAENIYATVVRTDMNGNPWLDENGVESKGTPLLDTRVSIEDEDITMIYFKIIAESGEESPVYTLKLEDMSIDTSLEAIYVNGTLIKQDENGRYETNVYDTSNKVDVKAVANNELAYVRISLGEEYLHISEENITLSAERQTKIPITVRSQSGITKTTMLYINVISINTNINVTLDGNEANYYNEEDHSYTFIVDNSKTDYELFAMAESNYANLQFEGETFGASFGKIVKLELDEEGVSYYVKVISEAGGSIEYRVDIIHSSDNVNLEFVKADNVEVFADKNNKYNYTVMIPIDTPNVVIEVQTENEYAMLRLGDNASVKHYYKETLNCPDLSQKQIVIPIIVTAADGKTVETYNITLVRDNATYLTGRIVTENVNGEYISDVTVYKMADPNIIGSTDEVFAQATTTPDGRFKIRVYVEGQDDLSILDSRYKVIVTKLGYLDYTITDIEFVPEMEMWLGEYYLIAGDVVKSGQIEIDDIVNMNENYGMVVTEDNKQYDLNEDGVIDELDRNILLKNYTKKTELFVWKREDEIYVLKKKDEDAIEEAKEDENEDQNQIEEKKM